MKKVQLRAAHPAQDLAATQSIQFRQHQHIQRSQVSRRPWVDVQLHPAKVPIREGRKRNARCIQAPAVIVHRRWIDPACSGIAKRILRSDPNVHHRRAAQHPRRHIVEGRGRIRDVRRRPIPTQARVLPDHPPIPALHLHHVQPRHLGDPAFAGDHHRQFSRRHAMHIGRRNLPNETLPLILQRRPLHAQPAHRVRPVEHHKLLPILRRRLHRHRHRADVGVTAAADVLKVKHQHIDRCQHLRCRFPRRSVEGMNGQSGHRIPARADVNPCTDGPIDPVLRRIQRGQRRPQGSLHRHPCHLPTPRHARVIRDQSHPLSTQQVKPTPRQEIDPQHERPTLALSRNLHATAHSRHPPHPFTARKRHPGTRQERPPQNPTPIRMLKIHGRKVEHGVPPSASDPK